MPCCSEIFFLEAKLLVMLTAAITLLRTSGQCLGNWDRHVQLQQHLVGAYFKQRPQSLLVSPGYELLAPWSSDMEDSLSL